MEHYENWIVNKHNIHQSFIFDIQWIVKKNQRNKGSIEL